jgi:hypothetical protein
MGEDWANEKTITLFELVRVVVQLKRLRELLPIEALQLELVKFEELMLRGK